jgi:hypothetical protein
MVPGSIPRGVTGFFRDISPSESSTGLGSAQPLVNMSARNIPGGKSGRCVRLTTSPTSRAERNEIWESKPPGTLWATPGLLRHSFNFFNFYVLRLASSPYWLFLTYWIWFHIYIYLNFISLKSSRMVYYWGNTIKLEDKTVFSNDSHIVVQWGLVLGRFDLRQLV